MIHISAELVKSDYTRYMRALKSLRWRAEWWFTFNGGELNRLCAESYANRVIENIHSQRYASQYPSYNPRYSDWKENLFPSKGFWELKSDLLKNLNHFRSGIGWMGGIQAGIFDSGGKSWKGLGNVGPSKEIAAYARIGEYGGSFGGQLHLGRPLFTPTYEDYQMNEWVGEINRAMSNIEKAWS